MLRSPEDIPVVSLFLKECLAPSLLPTHTLHGKRGGKKKQLIPSKGNKVVKFLPQGLYQGLPFSHLPATMNFWFHKHDNENQEQDFLG